MGSGYTKYEVKAMDKNEEEMLIRAALKARLPWFSLDAEPEFMFITDSQETIDKCCCCTKAVCINCVEGGKQTHAGNPYGGKKKADISVFADLIRDGLSMKQVCELLGIGRATFYNYRKQLIAKGAMA